MTRAVKAKNASTLEMIELFDTRPSRSRTRTLTPLSRVADHATVRITSC